MDAFYRLKTLSPILTIGEFSVEIVSSTKDGKNKTLPTILNNLPHPSEYEMVVPISSSWCSLS